MTKNYKGQIMTALAGWVGIDQRRPSSIYLCSDSRISFPTGDNWDIGRKLFASIRFPEILGYCGNVQFPSLVLGQVVDLIDSELLFSPTDDFGQKFDAIKEILRASFDTYPASQRAAFTVAYCTRIGQGMTSEFFAATIGWTQQLGWQEKVIGFPDRSGLVLNLGSGRECMEKWLDRWSNTPHKDTSRSVFGAFCDSLDSGEVKSVGGPPQLVGMYRIGPAKSFGIIYRGQRFLLGLPMNPRGIMDSVGWHNGILENCNWKTLGRQQNAQQHRPPRGLGNALQRQKDKRV